MKTRMRLICIAITLILLAAISRTTSAQNKITLNLWMHTHDPRIPIDKDNIAKFMKDNPNVDVQYTTINATDFDAKLNTALASGQGPDVFNQWTAYTGQFYKAGALAPVDPVAFGVKSIDDIYALYGDAGKALLAGATFDNKLYGIPTELSIYACYANNDLFKAAGLDPVKDFPATWEDMVTVATKLTIRDANGVPTQRGFDFEWPAGFLYLTFEPMVHQLGGQKMRQGTLTAHLDTPEVKQVMKYWVDWAKTLKLGGPQYTASRDAFVAKQLAIECTMGNWGVPGIEKAGIKWSVHPVPRWKNAKNDNGFGIYAYFLMVSANASADKQAAAWKLTSYLTSTPDRAFLEAGLFQ